MAFGTVTKPSFIRLGAFAAVLLLTSGLLVTLFDEARAATIHVEEIGTVSGSTDSFLVNIEIPNGQVMPIEAVSAVIEENPQGLEEKQAGVGSPLVEKADCKTPFPGCLEPEDMEKTGDHPNDAVQSIEFKAFFRDQVATGYEVNTGYFSSDSGEFKFDDGYGYDPTAGYGYGGLIDGNVGYGSGNGGYGYTGAALFIQFEVTIRPSVLSAGDYWFTFLADHGIQNINQQLNSPAQSFTVIRPGGGPATGTPATTITAGSTTAPAGATGAWSATGQTHSADTTITINTDSDGVPEIEMTLDNNIDNADITVVLWPSDNPPEGTGDLPANVQGAFFVQITISGDDGTTHTVTINVQANPDGADPDKAVGLKWNPGNSWTPVAKVELTEGDDGYTGSFEATCCSTFALAFDEEDPTISLSADPEPVTQGDTVTYTADADDNLGVDRVEFSLDGELVHTATAAPYTWEWDTSDADEGTYTVEAVAFDTAGNSAEDSTTSQVETREVRDDDEDDDDDDDRGIPAPAAVVVLAAIGAVLVALRRRK